MAGPTVKRDYTADDGSVYTTHLPSWVSAQHSEAATTAGTATMPKFLKARYRYYRITATGKEGRFRVCSLTDDLWTNPFNTAFNVPDYIGAGATTAGILMGRTGEKTKNA